VYLLNGWRKPEDWFFYQSDAKRLELQLPTGLTATTDLGVIMNEITDLQKQCKHFLKNSSGKIPSVEWLGNGRPR
jgi:hypothetical protein